MESTAIIVLAAGLGKRMRTDLPKVTHQAGGLPLVQHVLRTAHGLEPERIIVVTGYKAEEVKATVLAGAKNGLYRGQEISFANQKQQLGTGDAVRAALPNLAGFSGTVLILSGDVPLVRLETLRGLLSLHREKKATLSLVSLRSAREESYGRVVRDKSGQLVEKIIELKDCSDSERSISEYNAGIYAVDSAFLAPAIEKLKNDNAQSEYYLTDVIAMAHSEGQTIGCLTIQNPDEVQGVNTPAELSLVNHALRQRRVEDLLNSGVQIDDPATAFIDASVCIEPGAQIGPNVILKGDTVIQAGAKIDGSAFLENTVVHSGAHVKFSVRAENAVIGKDAMVGPFANLRPGTDLGVSVKVGNFVETKNAVMASGAKASHLTYLGDCSVGADANIGAGTITCNYDGVNKHKTEIGAGAFIGSNTALVAPVTIGAGAFIGAGSTITKPVAAESLAFTRSPQVEKKGWAKKRRK